MTRQARPEKSQTRARASRLDRLVTRARAALVWEGLWRGLAPALGVLALFAILAFLGLWQIAPRAMRMAGVGFFAIALIAALVPLRRLRWPTRSDALSRIDARSGLDHRPAATLDDAPANADADPLTRALWRAHRRRAAAVASRLRAGLPQPRLIARDPFALRVALVVALAASAIVAGPERYARLAAAFDWRGGAAQAASGQRLDAWIDPPAYTGRAPILLDLASGAIRVEAPVGAMLVMRASPGAATISAEGGLVAPPPEKTDSRADAAPPKPKSSAVATLEETRLKLTGDARAAISGAGVRATLDIVAIPDAPPQAAFVAPPQRNLRGTLTLSYRLDDDYGVASAEAVFAHPGFEGRLPARRVLGEPPRAALALGAGPGGLGEGRTIAELSDHLWGGAEVDLTLVARDDAGNEGRSETIRLVLPQRPFAKPLARALVEQRRKLALAPDDTGRIVSALEALLVAPEKFETGAAHYLGLRIAARRLVRARSAADLIDVADFLWEMALQIEDGDLSQAERELRAAQQALREALQRGAPPEEIARLTQDLRAAMDKFLAEMAERQARDSANGEQTQREASGRQRRSVTPEQLSKMIDELEKRARSGDRADAQKALDELQNLLDNLRTGRKGPPSAAARDMNKALDELERMTREQQELRDETYAKDQNEERRDRAERRKRQQERQRAQGRTPPGGDPDEEDGDESETAEDQPRAGGQMSREELRSRQKALRDQLDQTRKRLRQRGQDADKGLEEAEGAMREAEQELGKGASGQGKAVDAQGRALQGLRNGAQALAQRMQGGEDEGEEGAEGDNNQARGGDPLGRESGNGRRDSGRARYDPLGQPAAQRAQKVLEELRRRLSDPGRPREELDYLERLLRRY